MARLIAFGLLAFVCFSAGWKVNGWRWEAKEAAKLQELAEAQARADKRSYDASSGFEKDKRDVEKVFETVRVEVEKIVTRPVYRNICIDGDGLRELERAIEETAR